MSLVADYSGTSSSNSSTASDTENEGQPEPDKSSNKKSLLPSASAVLTNDGKSGEVFQTKYHKEEQAKQASLERHVKMVENDEHLITKNGRKICWNYRKGRCRFGTKCQYAHDSDLLTETPANSSTTNSDTQKLKNTTYQETVTQNDKDETNQGTKRKRAGLGDDITPGKRVMQAYKQQYK